MYVCITFLIRNWLNFQEKDQIWIFHDLLGASQHSQKRSEKKPLFFDCYDHAVHNESVIEFFYCTMT